MQPKAGSEPKNCHYVTQSLTVPWEGERRFLHYFDFDTEEFDKKPSRRLFAEERLNSPEVEAWLRDTIETPLGIQKRRVVAGDMQALDGWRYFRAATLMVWLQGARVSTVGDLDARVHLERLAKQPIEQTDQLVQLFRQEYELARASTIQSEAGIAPLVVPGGGIFPVLYRDAGCLSGWATAFALPLDVHCALVVLPVEASGKRDLERIPSTLASFSVGTSKSRKVVIPPAAFKRYTTQELRLRLLSIRARNDAVFEDARAQKQDVLNALSTSGLLPRFDGADRIQIAL